MSREGAGNWSWPDLKSAGMWQGQEQKGQKGKLYKAFWDPATSIFSSVQLRQETPAASRSFHKLQTWCLFPLLQRSQMRWEFLKSMWWTHSVTKPGADLHSCSCLLLVLNGHFSMVSSFFSLLAQGTGMAIALLFSQLIRNVFNDISPFLGRRLANELAHLSSPLSGKGPLASENWRITGRSSSCCISYLVSSMMDLAHPCLAIWILENTVCLISIRSKQCLIGGLNYMTEPL